MNLTLSYTNANIPGYAQVYVNTLNPRYTVADVQWKWEKDKENPYQTLYTATVSVAANEGIPLVDSPLAVVNGYPAELLSHDAGHATVSYSFYGPTLEPALYDGVDYGLIYQYDFFVKENPEVVEECGTDDPETMLDYYVYYGMQDGLRAISTFDAEVFLINYEKLMNRYYMLDTERSTLHYLENCYNENLLGIAAPILPAPAFTPPSSTH